MNIEIIKSLKERAKEMLKDNYDRKIGDEEIYTIICELENFYTAYEKEKRLAEANLKDSEEFQDNMCNHRCILNSEIEELKQELEKEKEKNKELEKMIKKDEDALQFKVGDIVRLKYKSPCTFAIEEGSVCKITNIKRQARYSIEIENKFNGVKGYVAEDYIEKIEAEE